jgi:hypothetical protein
MRQATQQHSYLPSLKCDGDTGIEIVYVEEEIFVVGRLEQPRQNQNLLSQHYRPNKPT